MLNKYGSPLTGYRESSYMKPRAQGCIRLAKIPATPNRGQRRAMKKIMKQERK